MISAEIIKPYLKDKEKFELGELRFMVGVHRTPQSGEYLVLSHWFEGMNRTNDVEVKDLDDAARKASLLIQNYLGNFFLDLKSLGCSEDDIVQFFAMQKVRAIMQS